MNRGFRVPPLARRDIRRQASEVRRQIQRVFGDEPYFPIVQFMDIVLPQAVPDFTLQICDRDVLGDLHGVTFPERNLIQIRSDVFRRAQAGYGRDRMTLAHELGHFLLHSAPGLARQDTELTEHPLFEDSEWQADVFAGELLVAKRHVTPADTEETVAARFGVTQVAARVQLKAFSRSKKTGRNI